MEKAFELQRQVRQNAREYESTVKDLYSWEQDIKKKEEALKKSPATVAAKNFSVRSHVEDALGAAGKGSPGSSAACTPTEKQDLPLDPVARQHKKANDIKDRGNNYVKQADYDRAIEAYTEAVEVYPYDPVYYINRALCYIKQERYDNCVEDCEAAIELDKLCVKAYYRRMQANESLGNNMEALKDCTTVLAIEPKNLEAKKSLARINDRLRKNANKSGPNFTTDRPDLIDILPLEKPVYKRSKQPMRRVPIVDIVSPRAGSDETKNLRISDEDIDKIFNSNCGTFEQVKKLDVKQKETKLSAPIALPVAEISKETKKDLKNSPPKAAPPVEAVNEEKKETKSPVKAEPSVVQSTASPPKPARSPSAAVKATKVTENQQKPENIKENQQEIENIKENQQKTEKIKENQQQKTEKIKDKQQKTENIKENTQKTEKIQENQQKTEKIKENIQKTEKIKENQQQKTEMIVPTAEITKDTGKASPMERSLPPPPSGTAQFHVTWKELSASQKYQYLKSIEIANLCKILGAGFDSSTLTDLLRTIQEFYVPNKEPTTAAVLLEISKNDEFNILAMLMSPEEKKVATSILSDIKNWPNQNSAVLDKLSKAYL